MLPLKDVLSDKKSTIIHMNGGTAFGPVDVNYDEIEKRPGFIEGVKRFAVNNVGLTMFKIKSQIELTFKYMESNDTLLLASTLPYCIVLPSSAMSLVAMFRNALMIARRSKWGKKGRKHNLDLILSSFPKLVGDPAARRVLMYFWARECPEHLLYGGKHAGIEKGGVANSRSGKRDLDLIIDHSQGNSITGKKFDSGSDSASSNNNSSTSEDNDINVNNSGNIKITNGISQLDEALPVTDKASDRFEKVVMCTWRAFCIPEARQSKLVPSESVEQTYKREILMRNEVENYMFAGAGAKRGLVKTKKISKYVASSSSSSSADHLRASWEDQIGGSENKIDDLQGVKSKTAQHLSYPFNPMEFLWSG